MKILPIDSVVDEVEGRKWPCGRLLSREIKESWEQIRHRGDYNQWHKLIWFKGNAPRFSFTTWLLCKGKLIRCKGKV
ncbi:hypothetical protein LIER_31545 [Lithospermum erythrorhizon]|uniref:Reverse transcriptase zinc-binding domain-containing protein n=1 Tax=Lithospermum erythrorhizon TaxID=34254 RepID=A0AAV3RV34_LITER